VTTKTKYTREETARLGNDIYERCVKPTLRPEDDGKFVAIDVDTEAFEIDVDDYTATMRLRQRYPQAEMWLACVGQAATYRLGRRQ
jgi:hypothetical protein